MIVNIHPIINFQYVKWSMTLSKQVLRDEYTDQKDYNILTLGPTNDRAFSNFIKTSALLIQINNLETKSGKGH